MFICNLSTTKASYVRLKHVTSAHGVRHGQKSGRANTKYIVYKISNSLEKL